MTLAYVATPYDNLRFGRSVLMKPQMLVGEPDHKESQNCPTNRSTARLHEASAMRTMVNCEIEE